MSAMTWRQRMNGSATATSRVTAPTRLALRRSRAPLPTHLLYHVAQRARDLFGLRLGQRREERQRDRARGDVLADGEGPLAMPEGLAVIRHQVDRGQIRLGLHAALAQGDDRRVAVHPVRQLDDEDEP